MLCSVSLNLPDDSCSRLPLVFVSVSVTGTHLKTNTSAIQCIIGMCSDVCLCV